MSPVIALGIVGALLQPAAAPTGAVVSGHVLEEGSGAPIVGAQVTLMRSRFRPGPFIDRPRSAVTDQDGRYEFGDLEAGRYRMTVQKAGFALPFGPGGPEVNLVAGERRANVNVMLQKGAVIVGRVVDDAGEPVTDARVMTMRRPPTPPGGISALDFLVPSGPGAQTNDLGEFRLFGLTSGEHYVQAAPRSDFDGSSGARATTMLPTYFPGTTDSRAAQPINVGAGQTSSDVVIRMVTAPAFQVSGLVADETGRPVANAIVRLMRDEPNGRPPFAGSPWHQSRTDASGRFTINNAIDGTYTLLAIAPVVVSGPTRGAGPSARGGAIRWSGISGGMAGGGIGGGVTTETNSNGTTIEYRDDKGTRVPITINQASISGLEVIVQRSGR